MSEREQSDYEKRKQRRLDEWDNLQQYNEALHKVLTGLSKSINDMNRRVDKISDRVDRYDRDRKIDLALRIVIAVGIVISTVYTVFFSG